jgi:hypothetical protein
MWSGNWTKAILARPWLTPLGLLDADIEGAAEYLFLDGAIR